MGLVADLDLLVRQAALDAATYADYASTDSVERAQKYVTALRVLITSVPKTMAFGGGQGESLSFDKQALADELKRAEQFVTRKRLAAAGQIYFDTRHFRD